MAKEIILTDHKLIVKKLEKKIEELEQANLKLQEYFSRISGRFPERENSPFNGKPIFSCVFNFTIDLELQKLVWLNSKNKVLHSKTGKLFLADTDKFTSRLISKIDRKRFNDIVSQYSQFLDHPMQTLLRVYHPKQNFIWVLACFEKVKYHPQPESYLQVQFIKLDESKELSNLYFEFIKKLENEEQYTKVELLTNRQREILTLLGKGLTSKEIADNLHISFHTVEAHRKSIAKKTRTHKRAALISLAAEVGILN